MTSTVRPFRPVCGTEVKLKFSVGSIRPKNPNATVVTELEFSASSRYESDASVHEGSLVGLAGSLTEHTILDDEDRIWEYR
jgi:hypothetical protein